MFDHVPLWLCEDITACCYMYCYFRNIFPPWSSQMTIILITNAMYHIRYINGEYEFKRKNPYGLITAKHRLHQPTGKTPEEETLSHSYCGTAFTLVCLEEYMGRSQQNSRHQHIIQSICPTVTVSSRHKGTVAKAQ